MQDDAVPGSLALYWGFAMTDLNDKGCLTNPKGSFFDRYPLKDYKRWPMDEKVASFPFPTGWFLKDAIVAEEIPDDIFYFVSTVTSGDYLHGCCVTFHEPVGPQFPRPSAGALLRSVCQQHEWMLERFTMYLANRKILSEESLNFVLAMYGQVSSEMNRLVTSTKAHTEADIIKVKTFLESFEPNVYIQDIESEYENIEGDVEKMIFVWNYYDTLIQEAFCKYWDEMVEEEQIWVPKAMILLSIQPIYYLMQSVIMEMLDIHRDGLDLNPVVVYLTQEVPEPAMGKDRVRFQLRDSQSIPFYYSRPPVNRLPMLNCLLRPIFESLSPQNIINIFVCLLLERKVLFVSKSMFLLSQITTGFMNLLFPLRWRSPYIPALPASMIEVLDAPVPLFIGMHQSVFDLVAQENLDNFVTIYIDTNTVILPENLPTPPLVDKLWSSMKRGIYPPDAASLSTLLPKVFISTNGNSQSRSSEEDIMSSTASMKSSKSSNSPRIVGQSVMSPITPMLGLVRSETPPKEFFTSKCRIDYDTEFPCESTAKIKRSIWNSTDKYALNNTARKIFLEFFVELLHDYRKFMGGYDVSASELFDRDAYIASKNGQCVEFWTDFLSTQMMQSFFEERIYAGERNFEIMLFDAWIDRLVDNDSNDNKQQESYRINASYLNTIPLGDIADVVIEPRPLVPLESSDKLSGAVRSRLSDTCVPRELPILAAFDLTDAALMRDIDKVPFVVDSVYLHFYTKVRLYEPRFKHARMTAERGLKYIEAICEIAQCLVAGFAAQEKMMEEVKKSEYSLGFSLTKANKNMDTVIGQLITGMHSNGLLMSLTSSDIERFVSTPLREHIRALTTGYRLLNAENDELWNNFIKRKAKVEQSKKAKEDAAAELQKINEEILQLEISVNMDSTSNILNQGYKNAYSEYTSVESSQSIGDTVSLEEPLTIDLKVVINDSSSPTEILRQDSGSESEMSRKWNTSRSSGSEKLSMKSYASDKTPRSRRTSSSTKYNDPSMKNPLQNSLRKLKYNQVLLRRKYESRAIDFSRNVTAMVLQLRSFTEISTSQLKQYIEYENKRILFTQEKTDILYSTIQSYFKQSHSVSKKMLSILDMLTENPKLCILFPESNLNSEIQQIGEECFDSVMARFKKQILWYQALRTISNGCSLSLRNVYKYLFETSVRKMSVASKEPTHPSSECLDAIFRELMAYITSMSKDFEKRSEQLRDVVGAASSTQENSITTLLKRMRTEHKSYAAKLAQSESMHKKAHKAFDALNESLKLAVAENDAAKQLLEKCETECHQSGNTSQIVAEKSKFKTAMNTVFSRHTSAERAAKTRKHLAKLEEKLEKLRADCRFAKITSDRHDIELAECQDVYNAFLKSVTSDYEASYENQQSTMCGALGPFANSMNEVAVKNKWNIDQNVKMLNDLDKSKDLEKYEVLKKHTSKFAEDAFRTFLRRGATGSDSSMVIQEEEDSKLPPVPPRPLSLVASSNQVNKLRDTWGTWLSKMIKSQQKLKFVQIKFGRLDDLMLEALATSYSIMEETHDYLNDEIKLDEIISEDTEHFRCIARIASHIAHEARIAKKQLKEEMSIYMGKHASLARELCEQEERYHDSILYLKKCEAEVAEYTRNATKEKRLFELRNHVEEAKCRTSVAEKELIQQKKLHGECLSQLLKQMERSHAASVIAKNRLMSSVDEIGMELHAMATSIQNLPKMLRMLSTHTHYTSDDATQIEDEPKSQNKMKSIIFRMKRSKKQKALKSWIEMNVEGEIDSFQEVGDFMKQRRRMFAKLRTGFQGGTPGLAVIPKSVMGIFKSFLNDTVTLNLNPLEDEAEICSVARVFPVWTSLFENALSDMESSSQLCEVEIRNMTQKFKSFVNNVELENGLQNIWHRKSLLLNDTEGTDLSTVPEKFRDLQLIKMDLCLHTVEILEARYELPRPSATLYDNLHELILEYESLPQAMSTSSRWLSS